MRGHTELVAARLRNRDVRIVAISMVDRNGAVGVNEMGQAFIEVTANDAIPRLDLRAVTGLRVVVLAHEDKRGLELVDRLTEFEPCHIGFAGDGYCAQWTKEKGLAEWQ